MNYDELVRKASKEELTFYHDFWKQYIALEKLVLETEKYVAFSKDNENAYSIQYNTIFFFKLFVLRSMWLLKGYAMSMIVKLKLMICMIIFS